MNDLAMTATQHGNMDMEHGRRTSHVPGVQHTKGRVGFVLPNAELRTEQLRWQRDSTTAVKAAATAAAPRAVATMELAATVELRPVAAAWEEVASPSPSLAPSPAPLPGLPLDALQQPPRPLVSPPCPGSP